jgi:hypothetical protein
MNLLQSSRTKKVKIDNRPQNMSDKLQFVVVSPTFKLYKELVPSFTRMVICLQRDPSLGFTTSSASLQQIRKDTQTTWMSFFPLIIRRK